MHGIRNAGSDQAQDKSKSVTVRIRARRRLRQRKSVFVTPNDLLVLTNLLIRAVPRRGYPPCHRTPRSGGAATVDASGPVVGVGVAQGGVAVGGAGHLNGDDAGSGVHPKIGQADDLRGAVHVECPAAGAGAAGRRKRVGGLAFMVLCLLCGFRLGFGQAAART